MEICSSLDNIVDGYIILNVVGGNFGQALFYMLLILDMPVD